MLAHLSVKNLAIVEAAEIEFQPGLTVVTGETGSGKSVLIGALSLLLGERADKGVIRSGAAEAVVSATFLLPQTAAIDEVLAAAGLPPCEEGETLLIRRLVASGSGSRCWVNDAPATLQTLRALGQHLVDMHGPYDHQSLLSPDFQLALLDAFGHCETRRERYAGSYRTWRGLLQERERLAGESGSLDEERERLAYTVAEIEAAALSEADEEELVARHSEAANAETILKLGMGVTQALDGDEGSAQMALGVMQQQLGEMAELWPEAAEWQQETRSLIVQLQELGRTINARLQRIEADPGLLAQLEERMGVVQRLKRRYGGSVAAVLATLAERSARLAELEGRGERLAALEGEIAAACRAMQASAAHLREERSRAAERLARAITRELRDLGFAKSAFEVILTEREPVASGCDNVTFRFAPNPGEPAAALREIASSGEISRVMLATKSVLAEHDSIPVLIFDEIDANVGGEIGRAVGRKLRALAATHQVVAITHLAQVAAYGQCHFAVSKKIQGQRTVATITTVEGDDQRAAELARMLGGIDLSHLSLDHAREMLHTCQEEAS